MSCDPTINAAIAALQSAMPVAPTAVPPGIGVSGAQGTPGSYATSNHTHASSVQRTRIAISSGGLATWTFTTPYSVAPIVTYGVENVSGATQPFVVNIVGVPTTTAVTFQVFKAQTSLVSILGSVVNSFGAAAAGTFIHCWAALPTQ